MNSSIRTSRRSSPKIISIPVHFVGSEEPPKPATNILTPAAAALKIQKVGRGYLVRKSVKKIASIRNEVEEIERRISKVEVVELMIKDPKERLRVNETLMALLFKLDSVRGVDSGVRDLRKAVIKKAIALQEKVDGIVADEYQNLDMANNVSAAIQIEDSTDCLIDSESALGQTADSDSKSGNLDQTADTVNSDSDIVSEQIKEAVAVENQPCHDETMPNSEEGLLQFKVESEANVEEENYAVKEIDKNCEIVKDAASESFETWYTDDCGEENYPKPQSLIEEGDDNCGTKDMKTINEVEDRDDDNKRNREMLEKMMEENQKMMKMMKQISERNEQQTRMLNSLNHRVEQLEKAFVCDKMRRKKKRQ